MQYLIPILISAGTILVFYIILTMLRRHDNRVAQQGFLRAVTHIFKQIKTKGTIDLILDGEKITLVATKLKKKK